MSELSARYHLAKRNVIEKEFSHMNSMQREAVFSAEGPLLILAGAGSGKTTVLINRAAFLLKYGNAYYSDDLPWGLSESDICFLEGYAESDVHDDEAQARAASLLAHDQPKPWQLMAITFTNKAAGELKQRLSDMLGEEGNDIWAMTFHASCARMLRRDADRLGYKNSFTIYDTDDQKRLVKKVMAELGESEKSLPAKQVIASISHAKDSMTTPEQLFDQAGDDFRAKKIAKIYSSYQKQLKDNDAMDFDDLLFNTVTLLETCPDVLEHYQRRFRYIMVDEYQDTNHAQYRLVKLLSGGWRNLCVVGDDDQSIYKFRGATIENILSFEKNYPDAKIIRLEQNYRSTQTILDAANSVIANNEGRHQKKLWTSNDKGEPVVLFTADTERGEADFIAKTVTEHVAEGGKYSECAVLYRMSALSGAIENHLMRAAIPYRVVAGHKFYDRKEIRDAIAYLSVISNPADEMRLTRIINEPKRGIGERSLETASEIASGLGLTLFEILGISDQFSTLSRSAPKMKQFYSMMCEFVEAANDPEIGLDALLDMVLEKTGYIEALIANDEKAQERIENLKELSSTLMRYQEDNGEEATLEGFLEDVALITDIDALDQDADCVSLMTLHAAKGLEFPLVVIPGAEEGIFPSVMTMYDPIEVEEDRRLAYVGITRAKKKLCITHAKTRTLYGQTVHNRISRYVTEIDPELLEKKSNIIHTQASGEQHRSSRAPIPAPAHNAAAGGISAAAHTSSVHYKPGDRVKHRIFGEGEVLSASPMGGDTLLEIDFPKVGNKKLMANFAALKKL